MIYDELKTPFRFYYADNGEQNAGFYQQSRFRMDAAGQCTYKQITLPVQGYSVFLPFQFFLPIDKISTAPATNSLDVEKWEMRRCDLRPTDTGTADVTVFDVKDKLLNISANIYMALEVSTAVGIGAWFTYYGSPFIPGATAPGIGFTPPSGYWYLYIELKSGQSFTSEVFYVPCANEYSHGNILTLEWWNSKDICGILYQKGYKNRVHIHGDLLQNQPTTEDEVQELGDGKTKQLRAWYNDNYTLDDFLPEYMYNAILLTSLHDNVIVTLPNKKQGTLRNLKGSITWENDSYIGNAKFEFSQVTNYIKTLCDNNQPLGILVPLVANIEQFTIYPMIGGTQTYLFSVKSNDTGMGIYANYQAPAIVYDFGLVNPRIEYQVQDNLWQSTYPDGSIRLRQIGSWTSYRNMNWTLKDAYGNSAATYTRVILGTTIINNDGYSTGFISYGQQRSFTTSCLANDQLPWLPGYSGINGWEVGNPGVIPSIEGDGSYIILNLDGTFTFYKVGGSLGITNTFQYTVRNKISGSIVGSAYIFVDQSL